MKKKILLLGATVVALAACGGAAESSSSSTLPALEWVEASASEYNASIAKMKYTNYIERASSTSSRGFTYTYGTSEKKGDALKSDIEKYDVDINMDNYSCRVAYSHKKVTQDPERPEENTSSEVVSVTTGSYIEEYGFIYSQKKVENGEELEKSSTVFIKKSEMEYELTEAVNYGMTKEDILRRHVIGLLSQTFMIHEDMWLYGNRPEADKYDKRFSGTNMKERSQKYYLSEREAFDFKLDWHLYGSNDQGGIGGYKVDYTQKDQSEIVNGVLNFATNSYERDGQFYLTDEDLIDYKYNEIQEVSPKAFETFEIPSVFEYPFKAA